MDIIIVAYLPNEQDIVKDQVNHYKAICDTLIYVLTT